VSKEKTSAGVVRVSIRFAKLVMNSMISAPNVNVVLFDAKEDETLKPLSNKVIFR
jgi:hypothetical protein